MDRRSTPFSNHSSVSDHSSINLPETINDGSAPHICAIATTFWKTRSTTLLN
jgi:hypothetical protein